MKKFKENFKRFWSLQKHSTGGFTLVELIVVIAILAILAGIAVPAYSGYVEKAERANDEALLAEINTAFVSTCAINGESNLGRTDVQATLSEGTFTYTAPFEESFKGFYEGGEFYVFEALIYNAKSGVFTEATTATAQIYKILKDQYGEEIKDLMSSDLGSMGAEKLLAETNSVLNWGIVELGLEGGSNFEAFYFDLLGLDETADEEDYYATIQKLGGDENKVYANAVALYAAQNASDVTIDSVSGWLGGSQEDFTNNQSGSALGDAAAIYALYMSYKGESYNADSIQPGVIFTNALADEGFKSWVTDEKSTASAELAAFQAAMGMISDENVEQTVLSGGFDNPEMITVLESLLGK